MSALRTLWFGLLVLAAALAAPAAAQDYPAPPKGPIYDGADILSPATEAQLDQRLRAYNRETGRAIIVATIPSLDGNQLESFATGLFADWGIGGEKRDQGLLLLIARDDRKIRIEVGYGLHPYFGGIMAGRVIRDEITPRFKQGDFDGGVVAGVDAITAHLARSPAEAAAIEEAARVAEAQQQETGDGFPFGFLIWIAFIVFFFVLPAIARGGRRYRGGRGGGIGHAVGNVLLWSAVNAAMNSGRSSGGGWGGGGGGSFGGGGGGGFGGFGGGMSGGGGASGGW
jgi:uncharacterized protein